MISEEITNCMWLASGLEEPFPPADLLTWKGPVKALDLAYSAEAFL